MSMSNSETRKREAAKATVPSALTDANRALGGSAGGYNSWVHVFNEETVERIVAEHVATAKAECADDHAAWREDIEQAKSDAQMWKDVAAAATRRAALAAEVSRG